MVPNCNDGSGAAPRLRVDISGGNVFGLPAESSGPKGDERAVLAAVRAAGFEGVQCEHVGRCRELGIGVTGSGRIDVPADAERVAAATADKGYDCMTLHVGTGLEDDATAIRMVEAVVRAAEKYKVGLYIETHRATITQDMWRTVQWVKAVPEVRFNGDFSHWYTGQEMVYGNFEEKLAFLAPVLERVRFIHGRIGDPGAMQVDVGETVEEAMERPYVQHMMAFWRRAMAGFRRTAGPGDYLCFTPELLKPEIYYARMVALPDGRVVEASDRWRQALVYVALAKVCWKEAGRG